MINNLSLLVTAGGERTHPTFLVNDHFHQLGGVCPCRVISQYQDLFWSVTVVFSARDEEVRSQAMVRDGNNAEVVLVPTGAKGALISALFGVAELEPDAPLVITGGNAIYVGDLKEKCAQFLRSGRDAAVLVFEGNGPNWSYIEVDETTEPIGVYEKSPHGKIASTGIVMYKSGRLFMEAAKWSLMNNDQFEGNFYVSSTLNYLISRGRSPLLIDIDGTEYQHKTYGSGV